MKPDYTNIPLQRFIFEFAPEEESNSNYELICKVNKFDFRIDVKNCEPSPVIIRNKKHIFIVLGSPIWGDLINKTQVVDEIERSNFSEQIIKKINGEFLIICIDIEKSNIRIINDRFASIPFYYVKLGNRFLGSYAYNDLWLYLKRSNNLDLFQESFYEMLHYRRLFGDKTYDKKSKYLLPASILTLDSNSISLKTYWTPSFQKLKLSLNDAGKLLAKRIKKSILRKSSDRKKAGLFLSGGFDTRTLLAGFDSPPICFTATYNTEGNREYNVAKQLAELKKNTPLSSSVSR